jgi:site-specific DNA-methyltransferase (adenine-specific)
VRLNQVIHGDGIGGLQSLDAGSVDLLFADPPFNIGYDYDVYADRRAVPDYLRWSREWIGEAHRVLKPGGTFWLAIGDEFAAELKVMAQHDVGFHCRSWVIWHFTFGVNCPGNFSRSHAHLLYFTKDPRRFTFNAGAVKVPSARQAVYRDKRAKAGGRLPDNTWVLRPQDAPEAFDPGCDTWSVSRVCGTFKERVGWHPCQMPEAVLERIILACSDPGDLVVDPFTGSGTTLAVANRLGRRWLGWDISPDYVLRAEERIRAATPAA